MVSFAAYLSFYLIYLCYRSSFNYKYEEPLYNLDTEPRFFKKTFETLSGFLTHTFSTEDATKTKEAKPAATGKTLQSRPVKQKVRNPLENLKPVKFPAKVHNYQEVPQHKRPSPDQNYKPKKVSQHQYVNSNNAWKPSQRLVAHILNVAIVIFLLFQIQCHQYHITIIINSESIETWNHWEAEQIAQ